MWHFQYPRVNASEGIGNITDDFLTDWPVVHAVEAGRQQVDTYKKPLEDLFDCVPTPRAGHSLHERMLPEKIDLLKEKRIPPLIVVGSIVSMSRKRLHAEGQPFQLYQFKYSCESFDPSSEN